jgi:hypothetical protein
VQPMQLGQLKVTPQELVVGMLVALGIMIIVRDMLRASDQVRMASQAEEYLSDPNKLAEEALEHLNQDPDVPRRGYQQREEEQDG